MDELKNDRLEKTVEQLMVQMNSASAAIEQMNMRFAEMTDKINENQKITLSLRDKLTQYQENNANLQKGTNQQQEQIRVLIKALNEVSQKLITIQMPFCLNNQPTNDHYNELKRQILWKEIKQIQLKTQYKSTPSKGPQFWLDFLVKDHRYFTQFMQGSKILTQDIEQKTMSIFFQDKPIKCMQLLYRASQHNFSLKSFHDRCDAIPNTLTLIQTQYNKKIGGFTPLTWQDTKNYKWKADQEEQSFIFSLTHGDKFTLEQTSKAIANNPDRGPIFGGGNDLSISKNANQNSDSRAYICNSYMNSNYERNNIESWERFTGNPHNSPNFKVKEWQVWHIYFV